MKLAEEATAPEAMIRLMNSRREVPPTATAPGELVSVTDGRPGRRGDMGWRF
jgi:hypothetical protein